MKSKQIQVKPTFRNVDLEIKSASKLDSLAAAMGELVIVLYSGPVSKRRYLLALESARFSKGPDTKIHALCAVVEKLGPSARRTWDAAHKEFDIGYDWDESTQYWSRFTVRPDTLLRMAKLGATLAVTYYRPDIKKA